MQNSLTNFLKRLFKNDFSFKVMSKLALILFLGTSDKLMAAEVISAVAAATGFSVRIFAAFCGLLALTKKV